MKLSACAKTLGMSYQAVWNHYKAGLIPNARKLPTGIIIVDDEVVGISERTAVYARVSSSENKTTEFYNQNKCKSFARQKVRLFKLWLKNVAVA